MSNMSGLDAKSYRLLDPHLQSITSSMISINKDQLKEYNKQLTQVIKESMIPAMKKADPLFDCVYKQLYYSGSSYENLRISTPNEFDINVELAIPSNPSKIKVLKSDHPGFVKVKVEEFDPNKLKKLLGDYSGGEQRLRRWLNDEGLLKREHVLNWMKSVVDKALLQVHIQNVQIRRSTSGPAVTLNVNPGRGLTEYSVDLVPVFVFGETHWPNSPVRRPAGSGPKDWCVVPKAPGYVPPETHWRISFYNIEKNMMNGLDGMKHIIKLIKLLRDNQNWHGLSSYYIKTVFMWEMEVRVKSFWQQSIGFLFVHMLKRFVHYLKVEKSIPFYWDKRHNLLSALKPDTIQNIGNRMEEIIKNIEKTLPDKPDYVKTYFNRRGNSPPNSPPYTSAQPSRGNSPPNSMPYTSTQPSNRQPGQLQQAEGMSLLGMVGAGVAVGAIAALGFSLFRSTQQSRD